LAAKMPILDQLDYSTVIGKRLDEIIPEIKPDYTARPFSSIKWLGLRLKRLKNTIFRWFYECARVGRGCCRWIKGTLSRRFCVSYNKNAGNFVFNKPTP